MFRFFSDLILIFMDFLYRQNIYRRSSDSADSISAVLGLVRIENRTNLPKFLDLVRIANHSWPAET